MFDIKTITEYQLEITTYCNAACPQCPRNNNGQGINELMPLTHLSREIIDQRFDQALCNHVRQIYFCGSYGDPIMHPEFLDILRDFRRKNSDLWLYIHTNGGVHDTDYWAEMASIIGDYGQVDFGIDGLEDTLHLYRRNVKYTKVMENAEAFIQAGGNARWNFIVFQHNEHQVDQLQYLSLKHGFEDVLVRNTGRFFNHRTCEEMPSWPVKNDGKYQLEPPTNPEHRNRSMLSLPDIKQQYSTIKTYFDSTPIQCDAALGHKVVISAEGIIMPCNFFNHNLYDRRFYVPGVLPEANELSTVNGKNQVRSFLESYGLDTLNIHQRTIEQVFESAMWTDLVASWSKTLDQGRLFECAMTCGKKLTKVWDQGGSTR
jgi:MoaA/NifB/PqqE/SkfB family radical SAM enzyme